MLKEKRVRVFSKTEDKIIKMKERDICIFHKREFGKEMPHFSLPVFSNCVMPFQEKAL